MIDKYLEQLLSDIDYAGKNVSLPLAEKELSLHDWISDEEEDRTAPVRSLEEWTGLAKKCFRRKKC